MHVTLQNLTTLSVCWTDGYKFLAISGCTADQDLIFLLEASWIIDEARTIRFRGFIVLNLKK